MSKQTSITVSDFSGGVADSPRKSSANEFTITKMFDIHTDPKSLIPYRSLEADTNDGSTATGMKQYAVKDFLYASGSAKLYGLGQTGAGLTKIVYKADATTGNWTLPTSSEGNGAVKNGCLLEYKNYLWGFQGTNQIWKWGLLSGTPSITNSVSTVASTITSVANGIIAADANGYIAYNNVIVRIAPAGTVTDSAKTVPDNYKITSLTNFGNYMAIAAAPISNYNGVSKVFIWNLSSDLFTETLDWGEGELRVLETVEGMLIGITDRYLNNSTGAGRGSLIIQAYSGGTPQILKEIYTQKLTSVSIPTSKAIKNNRLFWAAKIFTNTTGTEFNEGIWSFGRKNVNFPFSLTLDIIDESINTSGIQGFGTAGNYFFIAHSADGSIDKTNDVATYTYTSIFESQVYNFGDVTTDKRLDSVKVSFRKLVSGESVTAKVKFDDATSWTTLGTCSTAGELSRTFVNIESSGVDFPSGKELRLRLESTGGAEITSYTLLATQLNNI
jgi:hypothetical protein